MKDQILDLKTAWDAAANQSFISGMALGAILTAFFIAYIYARHEVKKFKNTNDDERDLGV